MTRRFKASDLKHLIGQAVTITHSGNSSPRDGAGVCTNLYDKEIGVDIELNGQSRWGFIPDELRDQTVEGNIGHAIAGRRIVTVKDFRNLSTKEAATIVRLIVRTSKSVGEIRERLGKAGFNAHSAAITSNEAGGHFQAMVIVFGPKGEVIQA